MTTRMALEGYRVLDFTHVLTGPYCTMLLADMGAEVIKIEKQGEYDRTAFPMINGESYYFMVLNRNKKGITLNLKEPQGIEIAKKLVEDSDVVVENFRPGVMARLGLGYDCLKQINPQIVFASISGFGQNSPNSSRPAFDLIAQALSGVMKNTGDPNGPPMRCGFDIGDIIPAILTAFAIVTALCARNHTQKGQYIDVAMVDSLILSQQDYFTITKATGEAPIRAEKGGHPVAFPYDAFRTKDDWVAIACWGDYMFPKLATLIGMPQLADESEFKTEKRRCRNRSACRPYIEEWLRDLTTAEALALLDENGVPASEIYDYKQVLESEQVKIRDLVQRIQHPVAGEIDVPGVAPKLSETPGKVFQPSPLLGEHNEEIYCDLLNYSIDQIEEFKKEGVI